MVQPVVLLRGLAREQAHWGGFPGKTGAAERTAGVVPGSARNGAVSSGAESG